MKKRTTRPLGVIRLSNQVVVTGSDANPVFTYLGAAAPGATFTISNPQDGDTMRVIVAATGRVTIQK